MVRLALLALCCTLLFAACSTAAETGAREVAITIDDLPVASASDPAERQRAITTNLVAKLKRSGAPIVGFVNENKIQDDLPLLEQWLAAGFELGNHTYSHPSLHRVDVEEYEHNILRGETKLRPLLTKHGMTLRWFRHPFLHTGTSLETRERVSRFLNAHGYRIAPVTFDNSEWIYARAFDLAHAGRDEALMRRVAEAYVPYMESKIAYFEDQSQKLFGRNIRHVLLLHANALNATTFDELVAMLRRRGYRFITLERAVEDPAYSSADTHVGRGGISWLHRWARGQGKTREFFGDEPVVPKWVMETAKVESE
ncbi:MAG TPA: polysaccharide deacetylase family protein [Thermoanaerobaculia bacterium]